MEASEIVTSTSGTSAPVGSETSPRSEVVAVCAEAAPATHTQNIASNKNRHATPSLIMFRTVLICRPSLSQTHAPPVLHQLKTLRPSRLSPPKNYSNLVRNDHTGTAWFR